MFRRGGSSNEGIMTGLVDRTKHADNPFVTSIGQKAAELTPELEALLEDNTHLKHPSVLEQLEQDY